MQKSAPYAIVALVVTMIAAALVGCGRQSAPAATAPATLPAPVAARAPAPPAPTPPPAPPSGIPRQQLLAIITEYETLRVGFNRGMDAGVPDREAFLTEQVARRRALLDQLRQVSATGDLARAKSLIEAGISHGIEAIQTKVRTGNGRSAAAAQARREFDEAKGLLQPAGTGPAQVATAVLRQFLARTPGFERYRGRRIVCFDPSRTAWLRSAVKEHGTPVMKGSGASEWPLSDARFRAFLQGLGWRSGDFWFPCSVDHSGADAASVSFAEWNGGWRVVLRRTSSGWRPTQVRIDGEGEAGGSAQVWTVSGAGNTYRFTTNH
ncbi:hypothetical protein LLH23_11845 [bacterium]|nr:hypothetical protein [bacterium]